ncbi:MAG: S-methyl-5-thioribose-1-phosphate isomerase [Candidatus Carbobacillus altaicus]|uniref:Methylthioribose-1-phosphate isomerase n=1 Tax=Candidatus Carbonibacillus altaicus TaxID=2163959 RepID=A0A2R6XYS9_9BACL|nr:S-methyl-5-thioribose-1-phosphate isomerase [Candidatus Carbobacillus altaicus]PTQ55584.1 MAG: Methylthioribose-1-phosphate isomerase [Candidatus Carbobacillus altaicus]
MSQALESYIRWETDELVLLDQTLLPGEVKYIHLTDEHDVFEAIRALRVRGAPLIGVAAAYGLVLGMNRQNYATLDGFMTELKAKRDYLASARPTAVNLFWALDRMVDRVQMEARMMPEPSALKKALLDEALKIHQEDRETTFKIGEHGLSLLKDGYGVLTHCNTGKLATAGIGTAVAPIYLAKERGIHVKVFADETRPLLQGARLTAWELNDAGIDVTLITDSMAAVVLKQGWVNLVIVGADRIAQNGDTANKIGTYGLALLAHSHGIPFYVAAPRSTIDLQIKDGSGIVIEERGAHEVITCHGFEIAPKTVKVYNPAFDVTPHDLIAGIITEKGIVHPPYRENLQKIF